MQSFRSIARDVVSRFRRLSAADLRWSFLIVAVLIVLGAILNAFFPHGWTVWPFVAVAGLFVMLNESTDRNGEGIPPLQVYALLFSALAIYAIVLVILSRLNLLVLIAGLTMCTYYAVRAILAQRTKDQLLADRLANGQCVHCGYPANSKNAYCEQCGEEPNPSAAQKERIGAVLRTGGRTGRMRAMLTSKSATADVKSKEQALLARRNRGSKRFS